MRRILTVTVAAAAATVVSALPASATIHPIVESFDCADEAAFAHHPLGDPADPLGQTPGQTHANQSTLRAVQEAIDTPAAFGHKLDGECGGGGG